MWVDPKVRMMKKLLFVRKCHQIPPSMIAHKKITRNKMRIKDLGVALNLKKWPKLCPKTMR